MKTAGGSRLASQAVRAGLNDAARTQANSNASRVYSDALRDEGRESPADLWAAIAEFLDVWHENGRPFWRYENLDYDRETRKSATDRGKFVALDRGTSGAFLVEKATGLVWSIRAYGRKNRVVMSLADLTAHYRAANAETSMRGRLA